MITKYRYSIFPASWLIEALILSYYILNELNPLIATIIGLLFSVPISLFWLEYKMPVLRIKKKIEESAFDIEGKKGTQIKLELGFTIDHYGNTPPIVYMCERIFIENIGRNAAKECKAYFVTSGGRERVCWTIPTERPNATINVEDYERLDFCAFPIGIKNNERVIIPRENGWENPWVTGPITECKILVTSKNAEPVEANIKIDTDHQKIVIE